VLLFCSAGHTLVFSDVFFFVLFSRRPFQKKHPQRP